MRALKPGSRPPWASSAAVFTAMKHSTTMTQSHKSAEEEVFFASQARKVASCQSKMPKVVVIGAGPAGIMSAIYLAKQGCSISVLEKREAPSADYVSQRTVMYVVKGCGQAALSEAGVEQTGLRKMDRSSWSLSDGKGKVARGPERPAKGDLMVERATLAAFMLQEAVRLHPDLITFHFSASTSNINFEDRTVTWSDANGHAHSQRFNLLVGADGRHSYVRQCMQAHNAKMKVTVVPADSWHLAFLGLQPQEGYWELSNKERTVARMTTTFQPPKLSALFWPNGKGEVSGSMTSTQENLLDLTNGTITAEEALQRVDPDIPQPWVQKIAEQAKGLRPSCVGATTKCSTIIAPGAVLIGDSAHSVRPTLGLGCNTALQSAQLLGQAVERCDGDLDAAVVLYERERLPDLHALYNLDITAIPRLGGGYGGKWNYHHLLWRWHLALWNGLAKLPGPLGAVGGPEWNALGSQDVPYRKIWRALHRDSAFAIVCIAASAVLLGSVGQCWLMRSGSKPVSRRTSP
ncbi:hypothetical protein WJX73_002771 [Symbiochloris irregularis]|uniref:FAD-binding domain-containing protein n=1 Tax=Symbiochloris irregularis TaxID=706552 RepID=A0AAW1NYI3_9CHLO